MTRLTECSIRQPWTFLYRTVRELVYTREPFRGRHTGLPDLNVGGSMREKIESTLVDLKKQNEDDREHLFDVKIGAFDGKNVSLDGRVLAETDLQALRQALQARVGSLTVDDSGVQVLRRAEPLVMANTTNLTSLYREPSWLAEQANQLLYGVQVEILEKQDKWAFVRCFDGYLGWAYLHYFTPAVLPPATHLVTAPVSWLRAEPSASAQLVTRVLGAMTVGGI